MKKIKNANPRKISKRIKRLSNLNLENYSIKTIANYVVNSFTVPFNTFPQNAGGHIFRACINDMDEVPFNEKKRIAYNNNPNYIGRANLKNKCVVYAGDKLDVAAIETCQDKLRKTKKRKFYLTIGEWEISQPLNIVVICHSKRAMNAGTDLYKAYNAIRDKKIRELNNNYKSFRKWNLINKFYADQFAKTEINDEMDYIYSAMCSNTILKSKSPNSEIDGIWYPSQAYEYKGFNLAYKAELIENRIIILKKVYHIGIEFYWNYKMYPKSIYEIKSTENIEGNNIIW